MRIEIERSSPIVRSPRVAQLEGLFDVPAAQRSTERWVADLPIEDRDWHIGLICGPSGSGKSTLARELWPELVFDGFEWPTDRSIVDGFPAGMGIKDITGLLSSVGFASPPQWLRPFHVLSTGQQMRVNVARLLAEKPKMAVMDEFTSVVDRTVAQLGSLAIAKAVRRRSNRFVAVTCHDDVEEWLQPDWVFRTDSGAFAWRDLQRPTIALEIARCSAKAWDTFKPYHYLTADMNRSAVCWCAWYQGIPVAFVGVLPMMGHKGGYRISRSVCLPEYQGAGIGKAMMEHVGAIYRGLGRRLNIVTALASINAAFGRSSNWRCTRSPGLLNPPGKTGRRIKHATDRITATWEYVGPALERAEALRVLGK